MRTITALNVAKEFVQHWICAYGPPKYLLSDNGSQFTSKLFAFVCAQFGIKNLFTAAYHPQTNGQTERFNRTILAGIRSFCQDNLRTWSQYVGPLTYAYNTQVHSSTGVSPFDLVVSRPIKSAAIRDELGHEDIPRARDKVEQFRRAVKALADGAGEKMAAAQARYKRDHDKRVRPIEQAKTGDWVYITREQPSKTEADDKRHKTKLYSKAEGPFEVIGHTKWNLTIVRDNGMIEQVTRNRASKAPGARSELYRPAGTQVQSSSNVRTQDEAAQNAIRTPAYEYETDEERTSSNGNVRHPIERVRSYDEQ